MAKIFYIHGDDSIHRAYIHLDHQCHFIKVDDYRCTCKKIEALIKEHIERTSQAPFSKIVMEANKDLFGEYLLYNEDDPPREISLKELESIFDCCKELNSPCIRNKVTTSKYLHRFGVMDGITKLRGLCNWASI